jgi:hypothetical protein
MLAIIDRDLFRGERAAPLPLEGRKIRYHVGGSELLAISDKESALPEQLPPPHRLKSL